ncbi:hypothetical protein [Shewanella sp. OMA3-2]|nr:hypothetical protein [Shewanella sp. OMA3-2]
MKISLLQARKSQAVKKEARVILEQNSQVLDNSQQKIEVRGNND